MRSSAKVWLAALQVRSCVYRKQLGARPFKLTEPVAGTTAPATPRTPFERIRDTSAPLGLQARRGAGWAWQGPRRGQRGARGFGALACFTRIGSVAALRRAQAGLAVQ
ncbi:hypothetical protein BPNSA17_34060 [Bordetella petrii]